VAAQGSIVASGREKSRNGEGVTGLGHDGMSAAARRSGAGLAATDERSGEMSRLHSRPDSNITPYHFLHGVSKPTAADEFRSRLVSGCKVLECHIGCHMGVSHEVFAY
jgi:hypothetical protein